MTPEISPENLRILHVVPYYPPSRVGGVGEVVSHIHNGLVVRGHRSEVVTAGSGHSGPFIRFVASSPAGFVLKCWRVAGLARRVDVVHVHQGEAYAFIAWMRMLRISTPVVLTLHVSTEKLRLAMVPYTLEGRLLGRRRDSLHRGLTMRVRREFDRLSIVLVDRVTFISKSAAYDVLPAERARSATVIHNGVPLSAEMPDPEIDQVELLFVGTYSNRKRVLNLPFILQHVRERCPGARMRIVGFGAEDHPEFAELARSLNVFGAFVFEGALSSSKEIAKYYASARVLLVPSAYEGLPMVILEGFQHALPCVATDVSGHPEVISNGVTGYLVPLDDAQAMADAAVRILLDPELGEQMGAAGRDSITRHFNVDRQVEEYVSLYRETVTTGRGKLPSSSADV